MTEKTGRNDPCPCGSGKKFKQCCLSKQTGKKKLVAKWLNPLGPNLMERTFGNAISSTGKIPPSLPQSFQRIGELLNEKLDDGEKQEEQGEDKDKS